MFFVACGLLLGGHGLGVLELGIGERTIEVLAEATLIFVLFVDAANTRLPGSRAALALPARLLGIGLPLQIALGALIARPPRTRADLVAVWPALGRARADRRGARSGGGHQRARSGATATHAQRRKRTQRRHRASGRHDLSRNLPRPGARAAGQHLGGARRTPGHLRSRSRSAGGLARRQDHALERQTLLDEHGVCPHRRALGRPPVLHQRPCDRRQRLHRGFRRRSDLWRLLAWRTPGKPVRVCRRRGTAADPPHVLLLRRSFSRRDARTHRPRRRALRAAQSHADSTAPRDRGDPRFRRVLVDDRLCRLVRTTRTRVDPVCPARGPRVRARAARSHRQRRLPDRPVFGGPARITAQPGARWIEKRNETRS